MKETLSNNSNYNLSNNNLVEEILKNGFLTIFEPNPILFNGINEDEVDKVHRGIELASGQTAARFQTTVNRRSFLAACLDYTCNESIEHLIVGYGTKWRNTTKIDSLHHVDGNSGSVTMTNKMLEFINKRLFSDAKGEVLIFHNHPKWLLNVISDNSPIASSIDRETASKMKLNPIQFLKKLFGNGDVKFYLGENGFVKEFNFPSFEQIAQIIQHVRQRERVH